MKSLVKSLIRAAGYEINTRDPLVEQIPGDYTTSPFLPTIRKGIIHKLFYYEDIFSRASELPGDIVECGVSIGQGALTFLLLCDYCGIERDYFGFDSFEGFPSPQLQDGLTPIKGTRFYANPPEAVLRTLKDGGISESEVHEKVNLIKGWFHETLPHYNRTIAVLHLDGDLYDSYLTPLQPLYDMVTPGGVIMFDEYNDHRWPGATKAVDEFFADKPERIQAHPKCPWKYFVVRSGHSTA